MNDPESKRVEVARVADVPERGGLSVEVGGVEIGVFRTEAGFLAIENACPHAGVPLSTGDVEACIVTCPAHGFQYDLRTGYAADHPDGFPIPRFEVFVEGEALLIEVDVEEDGSTTPRALRRTPPPRDA